MVKANTTVIAGGKTYLTGQTVTGLSKTDKAWMLQAGYITEAVTNTVKGRNARESPKNQVQEIPEAEHPAEEGNADDI